MPLITVNGFACHYRLDGRDDRPVLMLSHSLGLDLGMWDAHAEAFAPYFRVLRYDLRGHGISAAPSGDYTIEDLGADAVALADALGVESFAFCGVSLGGMVGQWIAAHAPGRVTRLVLANTSPRVADPPAMEARRKTVLAHGMSAVVDTAMARFFSPRLLDANPPRVATTRRTFLATSPVGYAGCCAALRDMDQTASIAAIRTPTLVVSGDLDVSMPWPEHGDRLRQAIAGARAVRLAAAHLSNLERPRDFCAAVLDFLVGTAAASPDEAMAIRRRVLGDAHVDRAAAATTDFTREFQALITQYAWGTIWSRPGLDQRTRRLLVLTTMVALGRWEEFRMHLRTGLAAELEWSDVKEVLLQAAIYAGVPAANTAFHIASEVVAGVPDAPVITCL